MQPRHLLTAATALALLILAASPARAEKFECLVEPYVKAKIGVSVPGIIEQVMVDRGDFVKKGQVLFTLQSSRRARSSATRSSTANR
jgi:multidrug efflux pump subunit AcrA (membrane-fusion protein)